jgi:hypothetical protein
MNTITKILPLILVIISSLNVSALEIQSQLSVQPSGEIEKFLDVTCQKNQKDFCEQLCSSDTYCKIPEILCEDCVTQKSQLMYSLFTDVNSIFKADIMFIEPVQLIGFLKNRKFISIPHDLFINMFTPEKKDQLKKEFEKLCYINVENAILLATVNENNQATDLVGVVCKDTMGSVVLPVTLNPEFSNNQPDFWQKLNEDIGYKTESLKLKMSMELK